MQQHFEDLRITRQNILNAIKNLTTEQLNVIPEGFTNNIIWNVGHVLVTQQVLIYKLSYLSPVISENLIDKYKKGSAPSHAVEEDEINLLKDLLTTSIDQLEMDFQHKLFNSFQKYTTSYNKTLNSAEEAIIFNNIHEGLHYGYILALKKLV